MSINRATVTGNLTRAPELRYTPSGAAVMGFCVAVNDRRKNSQTGEWEDVPNYIDCSMFGTRAEKLAAILGKGDKVAVDGRLRYQSWDRGGERRSKVSVVVEEVVLMGGRKANQPKTENQNGCFEETQTGDNGKAYSPYDEDIPF